MEVKDLIVRYGLVFPRRFYPKEKLRYIRGLAKEFFDAGMKVDIKEAQKNQRKAYNLYVGDIDKAGLTISAYYDTPPKTFGLVKHSVFCPKSDSLEFLVSILTPYIIIIAAAALYSHYVLMNVWSGASFSFLDVITFVPILILLFLLMYFRSGVGNKPNLVRNSAALIACVKLAEGLKPKDRNKISYAFTDYGCFNHYGDTTLKELAGENADKNTFILLDCIGGSGDVIVLYGEPCAGYVDKVREIVPDKAVFHQMDGRDAHYSLFNKSIIITSGKFEDGKVIAGKVNSSKDNDINEGNLIISIDILKKFVMNY